MYSKSSLRKVLPVLIAAITLTGFIGFIGYLLFSPSSDAKNIVQDFYDYEQEGNFSKSWYLFHSKMKERLPKSFYIQDRAHVFMNHFGVETFDYEIEDVEKVENWKMSIDSPSFEVAYKVSVTQTYKGKYGNFDIKQNVFVVKEKKEWKILWDYKK